MDIPKTRKQLVARDHVTFEETADGWRCSIDVMDVTGSGATQDEAFDVWKDRANELLANDPEVAKRWQAWATDHAVEVEIPEAEREAMRAELELSAEASKSFKSLTSDTFDEAIASDRPVLVDFWADWCMPCHRLTPILEEVARALADSLTIYKLDSDENHDVSERFSVKGLPSMLLFKNGAEVHRIVGAGRTKEQLIEELQPHLG